MATVMSLKLIVNIRSNKVLFAEAGKDFIDFLFSLLAMPVGSVVRLLSYRTTVGSLGKLYGSLQILNDDYMQPNLDKYLALNPKILSPVVTKNLIATPSATANNYYRCGGRKYRCSGNNFSDAFETMCPSCGSPMATQINYVNPISGTQQTGESGVRGYVKEKVLYMVKDDLVVTVMSNTSFTTLLNEFKIKEVVSIEEKVVHVRKEEGLNLLKSSMESSTVLTDVFLLDKKK